MLNRNISQIELGTSGTRTITFPSTVRNVEGDTFYFTPLISAVLNEGLEELGEGQDDYTDGVFH